ncbi:MAG: twin transmembrane helix small protein [Rhodospirillaceae bacterium]|nr:twin transmembrane helix small protein [Rhodospirillaceae bacterium]
MSFALPVLIVIAALATFGALAFGLVSMVRGGEFNARNSNRFMRLRVLLQLAALILIGVAFLFSSK